MDDRKDDESVEAEVPSWLSSKKETGTSAGPPPTKKEAVPVSKQSEQQRTRPRIKVREGNLFFHYAMKDVEGEDTTNMLNVSDVLAKGAREMSDEEQAHFRAYCAYKVFGEISIGR